MVQNKKNRVALLVAGSVAVVALGAIAFGLIQLVHWLQPLEQPPLEERSEPGLHRFVPSKHRPLLARTTPSSNEEEPPAVPPDHPFANTKITGRVYDVATNEGIRGASVHVRPVFDEPRLGPSDGDGSATYRTRSDGSYALKGIPPGTFSLEVEATGYLSSYSEFKKFSAVEDDDGFDVGLSTARSVVGRVVTSEGQPVDGAQVFSVQESKALTKRSILAETSDGGRFVLDPVDARETSLVVVHNTLGSAHKRLPESKEPTTTVEVVLEAGRVVRGIVVGPGGPVGEAQILLGLQVLGGRMVTSSPESKQKRATTSEDGRFEVRIPNNGPAALFVEAKGYVPRTHVVRDFHQEEQTIELASAQSFTGRVLAGNGSPAIKARIGVRSLTSVDGFRSPFSSGWTEEDGSFDLDGVPTEGPFEVTILHHNHPKKVVQESELKGEHIYELEAQARILGTIVDAQSGGPVTRYQCVVTGEIRKRVSAVSISGAFEIDQLPAGEYSIYVDADGYESAFLEQITLSSGQVIDNLTVRLKPAGGIAGIVRGGESADTITVHAINADGQFEAEAPVSPNGAFSFDELPSGTYMLSGIGISQEGIVHGRLEGVTVTSGQVTTGIEIALEPADHLSRD